jgi:hypothetical protein
VSTLLIGAPERVYSWLLRERHHVQRDPGARKAGQTLACTSRDREPQLGSERSNVNLGFSLQNVQRFAEQGDRRSSNSWCLNKSDRPGWLGDDGRNRLKDGACATCYCSITCQHGKPGSTASSCRMTSTDERLAACISSLSAALVWMPVDRNWLRAVCLNV